MNHLVELPQDAQAAMGYQSRARSLPSKNRSVAVLVAASLNLAQQLAVAQGWEQIAMHRYQMPEGDEVHAIADRSSGFIGRPKGTFVYIHPSWTLRDDWRDIDARMQRGDLVRAALPHPVQPR